MIDKKLIRDAVAYRLKCQCIGLNELVEVGITREEVDTFLDKRIGYAEEETIIKFRKWLDMGDDDVAEFARLYRLHLVSTAIYNLLTETCQTPEAVEETAAFLVDYIDEIKPIGKGRFN